MACGVRNAVVTVVSRSWVITHFIARGTEVLSLLNGQLARWRKGEILLPEGGNPAEVCKLLPVRDDHPRFTCRTTFKRICLNSCHGECCQTRSHVSKTRKLVLRCRVQTFSIDQCPNSCHPFPFSGFGLLTLVNQSDFVHSIPKNIASWGRF